MKKITTILLAIGISLIPNQANAEVIKTCRPRVKDKIQTVAQKIFYPSVPLCKKEGQGSLKPNKTFFFLRDARYRDSNGNIYKHPENWFEANPNKLERVKK
jgi:hypothetical protein